MIKLRYYTNIAPHYRKNIWEMLISDDELDSDIFFGQSKNIYSIKEIDFSSDVFLHKKMKLHRLKNVNISNVLVYQLGTIKDSFKNKPDIALFLGQAYIISNWIAVLLYRIKGVKVIFWGHGLYGNESFLKKWFNLLFIKIADSYLIYNNFSKSILAKNWINSKNVYVIYNSLNYSESKKLRNKTFLLDKSKHLKFFGNPELKLLIFIGRLTPQKKIHLLINALLLLNKDKTNFNLLIIGDGPIRNSIEKFASLGIKNKYIFFLGSLYDENDIGKYLSIADLCVSPGNVGLTAIHSLSYGTPVATHNNYYNQMPEFEAIENGKTGIFFKENDYYDIAKKINEWFFRGDNREKIRNNCFKVIDAKYNPNYQLSVIKDCVKNILNN